MGGGLRMVNTYKPEIIHLCYGIILTDYKRKRYIVTRVDTEDNPLIFLRERGEGEEGRFWGRYSLYDKGLSADEADQLTKSLKRLYRRLKELTKGSPEA